MKIFYLLDSLSAGGAETSVVDVLPALERHGVDVVITTLLPDDGALASRLRQRGTTVHHVDIRTPITAMRALRATVRAENPDLIHTTLLRADVTGRLLGVLTAIPVVTTLPNDSYGQAHRRNSRYGPWTVRSVQALDMMTCPLTRRFHAISHVVAEVMAPRLHVPVRKIDVIYRGRDQSRLGENSPERRHHIRQALGFSAHTPVLLSVARLDNQKGVDTAITAFSVVRQALPDAVLLIAGRPGNASADIQALATDAQGVRLLGHRTDVPDLMCAADVLCFPSRWEGFGGTLLEAMALNLPIVTTDIPPIAEALGDVAWPRVPVDDPNRLAEELLATLNAGDSLQSIRQAGRRRFLDHFTTDAAAEQMASFYRSCLPAQHRSGTVTSSAAAGCIRYVCRAATRRPTRPAARDRWPACRAAPPSPPPAQYRTGVRQVRGPAIPVIGQGRRLHRVRGPDRRPETNRPQRHATPAGWRTTAHPGGRAGRRRPLLRAERQPA